MASTRLPQFLRFDRRLLWLVGIAALLVLGELALRAWEAHQKLEAELRTLRGRTEVLAASSDQIDWAARTLQAETERGRLQSRLWQSPSEAQAQARLRDWLGSALRSAAVAKPVVELMPPQAAASAAGESFPALRVRAALNFELAPNALENVLVQIEDGGQLARVDTLSASARNRRVEMTVSVPVWLRAEDKP